MMICPADMGKFVLLDSRTFCFPSDHFLKQRQLLPPRVFFCYCEVVLHPPFLPDGRFPLAVVKLTCLFCPGQIDPILAPSQVARRVRRESVDLFYAIAIESLRLPGRQTLVELSNGLPF